MLWLTEWLNKMKAHQTKANNSSVVFNYWRFMSAKEEDGKFDVGWLHCTVWDFVNLAEIQGRQGEKKNINNIHSINVIKCHDQVKSMQVSDRGPDLLLQASEGSPSSWQRSDRQVSSLEPCSTNCQTGGKKRQKKWVYGDTFNYNSIWAGLRCIVRLCSHNVNTFHAVPLPLSDSNTILWVQFSFKRDEHV